MAKSAYNSREALFSERYDKREDYSRKQDCLFSGFYAPKDAPEWAQDRGRFWNAVEWREKRKDAQLGREFEIAIPHELTIEQARRLLQDFVRENFVRKGYAADVAIHRPRADSDERNIHAHVFIPLRRIENGHWAEKKDRPSKIERAAELKELRGDWEKRANKALERYGFATRIDMRSYADRGVDRTPGVHLGKEAAGMERRGVKTARGDQNRAAANENARRAANEDRQPTEAEIEQARELAAFVVQQRKGMRDQDEDHARVMWDEVDGSTLSNIRRREAEDEKAKRGSMDAAARRALDELARVDPIGTARNFGHHAGDQLKTPEQQRQEWRDQTAGPAPGRAAVIAPESGSQAKDRPQEARAAAQRRPLSEGRLIVRATLAVARWQRQEARREANSRPGTSMLRTALEAARTRLAGLAGRLEQARAATIAPRQQARTDAAPFVPSRSTDQPELSQARAHRDEASSRDANRRLAEAAREDDRTRDAQRREADQAARADYHKGTVQASKAEKHRAKDFADELLEQARAILADQKGREIERQHDEQAREVERVRELLRQDRQARKPHEPT